jgi:hypothetical protein
VKKKNSLPVRNAVWIATVEARVKALEKELALVLEQRVTVRAPEASDDPEWYS